MNAVHIGRNGERHAGLALSKIDFPNIEKDVALYIKYAEPVGTKRFRFSQDWLQNVLLAVNKLYCEGCARDFRKLLELASDHYSVPLTYENTPAFALILKKIDIQLHHLEGCYTLFNRMRLTSEPGAFRAVFEDRLKGWLLTKPPNAEAHAEALRPYIKAVLSQVRVVRRMPFKTWLMNRTFWARAGATDQPTMAGLAHTKAAWAFGLSDDELWAWWLKHRNERPRWKVFVKPDEVAAFRLIVNTDTVTYLKCAYISWLTDGSLKGEDLFAFASPNRKLDIVTKIQGSLAEGHCAAAFDGKGWDESITHALIDDIAADMVALVDDEDAALDTLRMQLRSATVALPTGEVIVPINGLASGLRWTTFINSVVNRALQGKVAHDTKNPWVVVTTLGDDVVGTSARRIDLEAAAKAYASVGFTLNVAKSLVSYGHTEFLKQIITPGRVAGTPLRSMRAILYGSAELERGDTPIWHQRGSLWAKFRSRVGGAVGYLDEYVVADLARVSRAFDRSGWRRWLHTSAALGGGGFGDQDTLWFRTVPGEQRELQRSQRFVINAIVRKQEDGWRAQPRLWMAGVKAQARGMLRDVGSAEIAISAVDATRAAASWSSGTFPYLVFTMYHSGCVPRAGALHDDIKFVLDGCRTRKEMLQVAEDVAGVDPTLSTSLYKVLKQYDWSLARQIVKGWHTVGLSANTMLRWGDLMAELFAPFVAATGMLSVPKRGGELAAAMHVVPLLRMFAGERAAYMARRVVT